MLTINPEYGANIAIGDWNDVEGKSLAEELGEYAKLYTYAHTDQAAPVESH
jgi:hypothetical protein